MVGPCCRKAIITITLLLGTLFIIGGVYLYFQMPKMIQKNIEQKLALNNGSESYKAWEKTSLPITFQIHLFNVTNPAEVILGGKPKVEQLGPYGFLQYREKYNVDFDDTNDTVEYRQRKTYVFSEELTNGTLNDTITMPNIPLLAVAKQAANLPGYQKFILNILMQTYKAKPFVTKTVGEMMFQGYRDDFMAALAKQKKQEILPNDTFGFFYGQNASSDGVYDVYRGNDDIQSIFKITSFNNMTTLPYWEGPYCSMINGSDGSQYPPFVPRGGTQQMFVADLCRSLFLIYSDDVMIQGINLLRFTAPKELLQSGYKNPDNLCYCKKVGEEHQCFEDGVMDISVCKKGAPIIVSLPHFYLANSVFLDAVDGLAPDAKLHETMIDVEHMTGIVMNAAKRLQMNGDMAPVKGISGYDKLPTLVFPLFWVYEGATINEESAQRFKSQLIGPITIGKAVTYALMCVGGFMVFCLLVYMTSSLLSKTSGKASEESPTQSYRYNSSNGDVTPTKQESKPMLKENGTHNGSSLH